MPPTSGIATRIGGGVSPRASAASGGPERCPGAPGAASGRFGLIVGYAIRTHRQEDSPTDFSGDPYYSYGGIPLTQVPPTCCVTSNDVPGPRPATRPTSKGDETYPGASRRAYTGVRSRRKRPIAVAVEEVGRRIVRIRARRIPIASTACGRYRLRSPESRGYPHSLV